MILSSMCYMPPLDKFMQPTSHDTPSFQARTNARISNQNDAALTPLYVLVCKHVCMYVPVPGIYLVQLSHCPNCHL